MLAVSYAWTFDPGPILAVAVAGTIYVARWLRVRRTNGPRGAGAWRLVSFLAGPDGGWVNTQVFRVNGGFA